MRASTCDLGDSLVGGKFEDFGIKIGQDFSYFSSIEGEFSFNSRILRYLSGRVFIFFLFVDDF
jgi:hypothetical protein